MSEASKRESMRREPGRSIVHTLVSNLVSIFFTGVAVMCVYNVFGVGEEVEALAKQTACHGRPLPCSAGYTRAERTPWAHSFKMYTIPASSERELFCQRQYILVGDYACRFKDEIAEPIPSGFPSAFIKTVPTSSTNVRFAPKPRTSSAPALQSIPSATPLAR